MAALVVGVPKEIKDQESRVSVQPDGVAELTYHGHDVVVQASAGSGCGFPDGEYVAAGARQLAQQGLLRKAGPVRSPGGGRVADLSADRE